MKTEGFFLDEQTYYVLRDMKIDINHLISKWYDVSFHTTIYCEPVYHCSPNGGSNSLLSDEEVTSPCQDMIWHVTSHETTTCNFSPRS